MWRRAFSLIELLVVVSIIGLLIAILLPSTSRAKKQARMIVCASNLRGLAQAVHAYATANDDRLVTAGLAHGGSVDEHAAWINTLRAEYGNKLVARCPSDRSPYWTVPLPGTEQLRRASYASNYYTVKRIGNRGPYNRLSLFKRPSTTIHMAELVEQGAYAASDHVHPETWWVDPPRLARKEVFYDRHLGQGNHNFMDAHAEWHVFEGTYRIDLEGSEFPNIRFKHNLYDPDIAR